MRIVRAHRRRGLGRFLPGIITGGADNDPSGISTYSVAGAQFGYSQLWIMVLATPMLVAVQAMVARIGDVTRTGLATVLRQRFPRWLAVTAAIVLVIANVATIGADLAGMGAAMGLVTHTAASFWVVPLAIVVWAIVALEGYKRLRRFLVAISLVFVAYLAAAVLAKPDWAGVLKGTVVPTLTTSPLFYASAIALLGTTITPYLFFWQAREEVEEHHPVRLAANQDVALTPGFVFSNLVSIAIMVATGTVLFGHGGIHTANDAAKALTPLVGPLAGLLFAIGVVGAGLLAVPVLAASTAYVVAETAGWREGLAKKLKNARGFYAVLGASILLGLGVAFSGIDPLSALFYSQVLVGFVSPFLIVLILRIATDRRVMGGYVANTFERVFGWITVVVMSAAAVSLLLTL